MLSGPATLLIFTLSRINLKSAVGTDSGQASGGGVDCVEEIKTSIKFVLSIIAAAVIVILS